MLVKGLQIISNNHVYPTAWQLIHPGCITNQLQKNRNTLLVYWKFGCVSARLQYLQCINNGDSAVLNYPDSKVQGTNIGPTWVLLAPDGPHFGPIILAIRVSLQFDIGISRQFSLLQTLVQHVSSCGTLVAICNGDESINMVRDSTAPSP